MREKLSSGSPSRSAGEAAGDHLANGADVVLPVEAAHREGAVVGVLRLAVDEHDHRRDDRLALDVRDVEALDPERQALEVQALAQLLERGSRGEAARPRGSRNPLRARRARSRLASSTRRRFSPRCGARTSTRDPRRSREELGDRLRLLRPDGHEHLRRDARRRRRSTRRTNASSTDSSSSLDHVLEMEAVAVDHLPVAQREDLHRGAVALDRETDHVDGPHRALCPPPAARRDA